MAVTAQTVEGIPSPPTFLTAVPGNGYVLLKLTTSPSNVGGSAISGYKVYRGASASGESSIPVANLTGAIFAYNGTDVTDRVPYYYVVKAVNTNGTSNPSNEVLATPINPGLPSAPKNVVATPGAGKIVVTWDAPDSVGTSPITGYSLYRSDNEHSYPC